MNSSGTIVHWLHLMAAIIWIGGNAFQAFILGPFIKPDNPSHDILLKISRRFNRLSLGLLILLVVTGGLNFGNRVSGIEEIPNGYISALAVKVFLIVAMAVGPLFSMVRPDDENPQKVPSLSYAKISFAVGIVIVFLAAMLRMWKF